MTKGPLPTLSDHDGHLYLRDEGGGLLVGCFEPKGKSIEIEDLQDIPKNKYKIRLTKYNKHIKIKNN